MSKHDFSFWFLHKSNLNGPKKRLLSDLDFIVKFAEIFQFLINMCRHYWPILTMCILKMNIILLILAQHKHTVLFLLGCSASSSKNRKKGGNILLLLS
jgi:hypothetical protein